jgi:hypothetical protein
MRHGVPVPIYRSAEDNSTQIHDTNTVGGTKKRGHTRRGDTTNWALIIEIVGFGSAGSMKVIEKSLKIATNRSNGS